MGRWKDKWIDERMNGYGYMTGQMDKLKDAWINESVIITLFFYYLYSYFVVVEVK